MSESNLKTFECESCKSVVKESFEFCPECGSIFKKALCENHPVEEATGVCIICSLPFCSECGGNVNDKFLCEDHSGYEIYQGMARVYGTSDAAQADFVQSCLEQDGIKALLYSRKASPISLGGADYSLFRSSGEFDGHIINEIKVMVHCQNVLRAEELINELDL